MSVKDFVHEGTNGMCKYCENDNWTKILRFRKNKWKTKTFKDIN